MLTRLFFLCFTILIHGMGLSQWSRDPAENLKALDYCMNPWIVSDNSGGAIIVGATYTVSPFLFAQRVDKYGKLLWDPTTKGIRVSSGGDEQSLWIPSVVSDGLGGAYIAFQENFIVGRYLEPPENKYFHRLRVQRMDADGNRVFGNEGLSVYYYPVDSLRLGQFPFSMISDGDNGVYILWYDHKGPKGLGFYLNHITPEGQLSWGDGIKSDATCRNEDDFLMYDDGEQGVMLYLREYAQHRLIRYNKHGEKILDKSLDPDLSTFYLFSAYKGECLLFWQDFNQSWTPDTIRCQRINKNGEKLWRNTAVIVDCTGIVASNLYTGIASDYRGGAYIAYGKGAGVTQLIHLNRAGKILFKKQIKNFNGERFSAQNCMVGYPDRLIYSVFYSDTTLAFAMDSVGNELWSNVLFCTRKLTDYTDAVISDGNRGAIFAWYENLPLRGTWIQQVNREGKLGQISRVIPPPVQPAQPDDFQLLPAYPNPGQRMIHLPYQLSQRQPVTLKIYNLIGEEVRRFELSQQNQGMHSVIWDGCDANHQPVANGVYFYQLITHRQEMGKFILLR